MNKILIISGSTASGKTQLALHLARQYHGELVSADSRQVYQGMDIVTGKDLPQNAIFVPRDISFKNNHPSLTITIGTYTIEKIPVWGLDLVKPKDTFDVTAFIQTAHAITADIMRRKKLPILVGGTGYYIKSFLEPQSSFGIPPNIELRQRLVRLGTITLQKTLQQLDLSRWNQLNHSDQNNPRRLIRAIEVAEFQAHHPQTTLLPLAPFQHHYLWLAVTRAKTALQQRIHDRVLSRIAKGAEAEVKELIDQNYSWQLPSMSTLGYKEWQPYFQGAWDLQTVIDQWSLHEYQYAKRQLTWLRNQPNIQWLQADSDHYLEKTSHIVRKWVYGEN